MSVKMRQEVEKKIVGAFVGAALAAGHRLTVCLERGYDIESQKANGVHGTRDREKIMAEAFAGDECHIFIHDAEGALSAPGTEANARTLLNYAISGANPEDEEVLDTLGYVYCVFGNDGWDVISDYTTNLEHLLVESNKISDRYAD